MWVLTALASMALEEECLYSFQSVFRSVPVISLRVSFVVVVVAGVSGLVKTRFSDQKNIITINAPELVSI